jgi:phospholipase/carboxylesterase
VDDFSVADDLQGYPVAIGHGTLDPIISIEFGRLARDTLEDAGCDVLYRESPIPHTIYPAFAVEARSWVDDRLAP